MKKKQEAILMILADRLGVYEVVVRTPAASYEQAEHLSAAIQPAIAIIDGAVREMSSDVSSCPVAGKRLGDVGDE
jgi:hypothetical protein